MDLNAAQGLIKQYNSWNTDISVETAKETEYHLLVQT